MGRIRDGFTTTGASAGLIALLLTASTGTAVAAARQITSANIKNHSIKAIDLAKNSVNSSTIGDGTITGSDIKNGSLTRADIANETVTGKQVKDQSLTGADINSSTLHQVPSARHADDATTVNGVHERITAAALGACTTDSATKIAGDTHWYLQIECVTRGGSGTWYLELYVGPGSSYREDYHDEQFDDDVDEYSEDYVNTNTDTPIADFYIGLGSAKSKTAMATVTVMEPDGSAVYLNTATRPNTATGGFQYSVETRSL